MFAVSITLNTKDPIDHIFLIPNTEFNTSNFMLLSESDEQFTKYQIDSNKDSREYIVFH
jgi:hypothetical protein